MMIYASSSSPGKLAELVLASRECGMPDLQVEPLPELKQIPPPAERGATFEENACTKATYYSGFTSELVLADDSGLEVDALQGAPGVYSARYAGPNATDSMNNDLLLRQLEGVTSRTARYVSVVALAQNGRILHSARGSVEGEILSAKQGQGGFGYDPLFFYPPFGRSFAELTAREKFSVSHRGNALRALFRFLKPDSA